MGKIRAKSIGRNQDDIRLFLLFWGICTSSNDVLGRVLCISLKAKKQQ
jgi:hypothetical protein